MCLVGEDIHGKAGVAASVFNTVADAGVKIRIDFPRGVGNQYQLRYPGKRRAENCASPACSLFPEPEE